VGFIFPTNNARLPSVARSVHHLPEFHVGRGLPGSAHTKRKEPYQPYKAVHGHVGPMQTPGREHPSARRLHRMVSAATGTVMIKISIRIPRKPSSVVGNPDGLKRRRNSANLFASVAPDLLLFPFTAPHGFLWSSLVAPSSFSGHRSSRRAREVGVQHGQQQQRLSLSYPPFPIILTCVPLPHSWQCRRLIHHRFQPIDDTYFSYWGQNSFGASNAGNTAGYQQSLAHYCQVLVPLRSLPTRRLPPTGRHHQHIPSRIP